ncbi:APC family permease [Vulgatibacter incomptus]|uniref:Amino acid permease n=1 Tax=Vulgatibacter incomptus TaxID=1391653 RepID=A0A0K1PHE6_9BACT|nr:APC family permease [Vulgatibacter incomptus]AKU92821.1 Amino acid permease [Vulgatibacter incomptus]
MSLRAWVFGRRLATAEEAAEEIGPREGVPALGLDALSSAAYGPEAALTVLLVLGAVGVGYLPTFILAIVALLLIVYFSYRQTIAAYPNGGGSYIVAHANLGPTAGIVAAASLSIDYILNVAVGISAGVGAVVSVFPVLQPHLTECCLVILAFLTLVNLRGIREAGLVFMAPTYLFCASVGLALALGVWHTLIQGGHPRAITPSAPLPQAVEPVGLWLMLRAFANGCTALTGVEAVSNAVPAFREPRTRLAQRTLGIIIGFLALMLLGIGWLCKAYGVGATEPGQPGYQSVLSQLVGAIAGRGVLYFVVQASTFTVLCLSANTSFSDFPRVSRLLAMDGYLPNVFTHRGRRLAFSGGIIVLAVLAGMLLILFRGVTNSLIPLFAVGAFGAFTMSQAGMVKHWWDRRREGGFPVRRSMAMNAVGAVATGTTLAVIIASKFTEGAWISLLLIAALFLLYSSVHRYYVQTRRALERSEAIDLSSLAPVRAVVPLKYWNKASQRSLALALRISKSVQVVQVMTGDDPPDRLRRNWHDWVVEPARAAGLGEPELVEVPSNYRQFVAPLVAHVRDLQRRHPGCEVVVILSAIHGRHWYHQLLHNHRAEVLEARFLLREKPAVTVIVTPWRLDED